MWVQNSRWTSFKLLDTWRHAAYFLALSSGHAPQSVLCSDNDVDLFNLDVTFCIQVPRFFQFNLTHQGLLMTVGGNMVRTTLARLGMQRGLAEM